MRWGMPEAIVLSQRLQTDVDENVQFGADR